MTLSYYADVDKALAEWFKRVRRINVPVSGPLSAEKALYFAKQLGYKDFKASAGFLDRFKERQGITGQHICGEEKSVGADIVSTWAERLPDVCRSYEPRDRFNTDESGKQLPLKQSILKVKSAAGERTVKNVLPFSLLATRTGQTSYHY